MKLSLFTALVLGLMLRVLAQSQETQIVRLSPAAFPELPTNLVQELQRRQCTNPQEAASEKLLPTYTKKPITLSRGSLPNPAKQIGPCSVRCGYSRGIGSAAIDYMVHVSDPDHVGPKLPPIDHQGIEDAFVGKAFLVWYYYDGQWLKVAGGD